MKGTNILTTEGYKRKHNILNNVGKNNKVRDNNTALLLSFRKKSASPTKEDVQSFHTYLKRHPHQKH